MLKIVDGNIIQNLSFLLELNKSNRKKVPFLVFCQLMNYAELQYQLIFEVILIIIYRVLFSVVLRNHLAQEAIEAAETGDYSKVNLNPFNISNNSFFFISFYEDYFRNIYL